MRFTKTPIATTKLSKSLLESENFKFYNVKHYRQSGCINQKKKHFSTRENTFSDKIQKKTLKYATR